MNKVSSHDNKKSKNLGQPITGFASHIPVNQNRVLDSDESIDSNKMSSPSQSIRQSISDYEEDSKGNLNKSKSSFDPQEFLFEKKQSLDHFFITVYD